MATFHDSCTGSNSGGSCGKLLHLMWAFNSKHSASSNKLGVKKKVQNNLNTTKKLYFIKNMI